jgi:hypothetical protein
MLHDGMRQSAADRPGSFRAGRLDSGVMVKAWRIVAAILVGVPALIAAGVIIAWMPLPSDLDVQWSGAEVTNTQPLWVFFIPIVVLTAVGLVLAVTAAIGRDRGAAHRGTLFVAALLTAVSAGVGVALIAINLGYAAPTGPAVLGAIAVAPIYALLPLSVTALGARRGG